MKMTQPPKPCGVLGGMIFRSGQGSTIAQTGRNRRKKGTLRQQTVRVTFAGLAAQWTTGLTAGQKTAWTTYANGIAENTSGCAAIQKNGYQWWLAINIPRRNAFARGAGAIFTTVQAPATADRGGAPPTITAVKVNSFFVRVEGTTPVTADTNEPIIVTISDRINEGEEAPANPWPLSTNVDGPDVSGNWVAVGIPSTGFRWFRDSKPTVGDRVAVKVTRFREDGRPSLTTIGTFTVAAI